MPDNVAVIGCDNLNFAALTQPSLTTIELGDLGDQIADTLLAMLKAGKPPTGTMGTATVIPRESA